MALHVDRREGGVSERHVLVGMTLSRAVLGPIADRWEPALFPSPWANVVAGWCVDHYRKHRTAPGKGIVYYFERWAEGGRDPAVVSLVRGFLEGLSDEYDRLKRTVPAPAVLLDVAGGLFERTRLFELRNQIEACLEVGDVARARECVDRSRKIEIGLGAGINVLADTAAMANALDSRHEVLVEYPGAAGNFFANTLARDSFVSFLGKDKVGKSFFLHDLAWRAVEQRRNTAYFELGDMSQGQVLKRFAARACGRPLDPCRYEYPTSIETPDDKASLPTLETEYRRHSDALTEDDVAAVMKEAALTYGDDRLKLSCHPNSSLSVGGVETILEAWDRDGWRPDVVVLDYVDLAAPIDGRADVRDQVNASWKALRALSQKWHCLVVTATQTDTDGYSARVLARDNFSEDKRKNAHVTGMIGINQSDREKAGGLYRLNWVVARDLEFGEKKCLWLASCLAVANPCVLSTF